MDSFIRDWLNFNPSAGGEEVLFCAQRPRAVALDNNGNVRLDVPFQPYRMSENGLAVDTQPLRTHTLTVSAIGDEIVRVTFGDGRVSDDSPMLDWHASLKQSPLAVHPQTDAWQALDHRKHVRLRVRRTDPPVRRWNGNMPAPAEAFTVSVLPDGRTEVPFMSWDTFSPGHFNSFPLAYIEHDGDRRSTMFSLHSAADECFVGTGERFAKMDLSGRTIALQNADALGVNNRRAYKNVPFYISSHGYGLLILTSAHTRLSLADISTRAAMGMVEHDTLDLFFIGGDGIERILYNYRRLTGFPHNVPTWSYGTWMGRMTYASAAEVTQVATRLREERFPCDVLHIDTGWFKDDWACDWQFCNDKFPEDRKFISSLRDMGYRVSLWQLPKISVKTPIYNEALAIGVLPKRSEDAAVAGGSNFSSQRYAGSIDLTNPRAVEWYHDRLRELFDKGIAAIKADFGEEIDMKVRYHDGSPALLHNLYALLYQKLIYQATQEAYGENAVIWARAGWIGCQRYPVHWAGDAACSWDGLAASIRGGLHLGLSGFGFWSHDVPGFHGIPDFMNTWPSDDLYVRWTQAAVFGSHLRYHGAQPREPYEYPHISNIVRQWLRLRYALIPYLAAQGQKTCRSGYPLLRAMILHHENDPACWHIDDQFFCGDDLLVAPILNARCIRNVYLPAGKWMDFWTGESIDGPRWLHNIQSPIERIPVYARYGSDISVYPTQVLCTDEMDFNSVATLRFDDTYTGLSRSPVIGKSSSWQIAL